MIYYLLSYVINLLCYRDFNRADIDHFSEIVTSLLFVCRIIGHENNSLNIVKFHEITQNEAQRERGAH